MVDAGFLKALLPDEYGGNKFSSLAFTLVAEELARVGTNTPTAVLATGVGLQPIIRFGSDEQKARRPCGPQVVPVSRTRSLTATTPSAAVTVGGVR
ncbi:acyl-CoA dehydrogenase family protein [Actinomycetospora lemnae]